MAFSAEDIPDLRGRVAVVTGATGGLGFESARALARRGAHVVLAARNPERTAAAEKRLREELPEASLEAVRLDLASLRSVREAAERILAEHRALHLLVNNAGLMAIPEQQTEDGFEMQLGVNHLGHWALTALLLPALLRAETARVVTVTSVARFFGRPVDPANPHLRGRYGPWRAYGQSKLANYHFALGLERRFRDAGVRAASLAAHPGLTHTELQERSAREGGDFLSRIFLLQARATGMRPERGALPQLRAATDPSARGGQLYGPRFGLFGPPVRRPVLPRPGLGRAIRTLFEVSERETGIRLDVAAALRGGGGAAGG